MFSIRIPERKVEYLQSIVVTLGIPHFGENTQELIDWP